MMTGKEPLKIFVEETEGVKCMAFVSIIKKTSCSFVMCIWILLRCQRRGATVPCWMKKAYISNLYKKDFVLAASNIFAKKICLLFHYFEFVYFDFVNFEVDS